MQKNDGWVKVWKGNGTLSWWCMFEQWLIEKDRRRLENLWITFFIADVEKACLSLTINHVGIQHWRTPSHGKKGRERVQLDKEAKINVKWFFFERSPKSSLYSFYSGSVSSNFNPNDDDGEHFSLLFYFFASLLVFRRYDEPTYSVLLPKESASSLWTTYIPNSQSWSFLPPFPRSSWLILTLTILLLQRLAQSWYDERNTDWNQQSDGIVWQSW